MSEISDEDVYDIEEIIKDRMHNGKKQYFIKWQGYPHSSNTWEDSDNVFDEELKKEYEEKKKAKESKSKKEVAKTPASVKKKAEKRPKFEMKVTNEWAETVEEVTGVRKGTNGLLEVDFVTLQGIQSTATNEEFHIKAPVKLLEFYEKNITFD
ncbi:hypothetical protein ENBRE01_0946 [Enteropsectra breve]|nr:hypothetical protein ENBRE01_0946 [Enteropsectra breve]